MGAAADAFGAVGVLIVCGGCKGRGLMFLALALAERGLMNAQRRYDINVRLGLGETKTTTLPWHLQRRDKGERREERPPLGAANWQGIRIEGGRGPNVWMQVGRSLGRPEWGPLPPASSNMAARRWTSYGVQCTRWYFTWQAGDHRDLRRRAALGG